MRNSPAAESAGGARAELLLRGLPWLACLFGVWPLLRGGFPNGHDTLFELVRISQYREAFAAGQWPPFWSEHLYAGYGSPVFLFYAPLFSAAASVAAWLAGSVEAGASWLLVAISLVSVPLVRGFLDSAARARGAARLGRRPARHRVLRRPSLRARRQAGAQRRRRVHGSVPDPARAARGGDRGARTAPRSRTRLGRASAGGAGAQPDGAGRGGVRARARRSSCTGCARAPPGSRSGRESPPRWR